MNSMSTHPCSFTSNHALMIGTSTTSFHMEHSHPNYDYIIKNFEQLIAPSSDQNDIKPIEKIRNLIVKTQECLSSLESSLPEEKTDENKKLRMRIKKEITEERRILGLLEQCYVQVSLATVKEKQDALKLGEHKKRWALPHK